MASGETQILNSNSKTGVQDPLLCFVVVLVGEAGVGKSNLYERYVNDRYDPNSAPTLGSDFCVTQIDFGDREVALHLWDSAGQERFHAMTNRMWVRVYLSKSQFFSLMFGVARCKHTIGFSLNPSGATWLSLYYKWALRVHSHLVITKSDVDTAPSRAHRESNFMFTLSSDHDHRKKFAFAFNQWKCTLKPSFTTIFLR